MARTVVMTPCGATELFEAYSVDDLREKLGCEGNTQTKVFLVEDLGMATHEDAAAKNMPINETATLLYQMYTGRTSVMLFGPVIFYGAKNSKGVYDGGVYDVPVSVESILMRKVAEIAILR